jgi:hypothetical protein
MHLMSIIASIGNSPDRIQAVGSGSKSKEKTEVTHIEQNITKAR